MESQGLIEATISTLNKLKGKDYIFLKDIRKAYGPLWASVFDELRVLGVVYSPTEEGKVTVNQNYIEPAIEHCKAILHGYIEAKRSSSRSWIALAISIINIIVSVLSSMPWK